MALTLPLIAQQQSQRQANFSVARTNDGSTALRVNGGLSCPLPPDLGAVNFAAIRDTFGSLIGLPIGPCQQAMDAPSFVDTMDLYGLYRNRYVPFFSDIVMVQVLNARAGFLSSVISPLWETTEQNFTVQRRSVISMPFTEVAPCGIPEQQSHGHFMYNWTESAHKFVQSAEITIDVALDPLFGAQIWLEKLAQFVENANLTINMLIITAIVQIGYMNMTQNQISNCAMDVHKLYLAESEAFFIMALDPEAGLTFVGNLEVQIPGLDTLILPQGGSRYIRDIAGQSQSMFAQRVSTNPETLQAFVDFITGPDSFKSIKLGNGNGTLHVIEFTPFMIAANPNEQVCVNPLLTRTTIAQFYPPNPFVKVDDCVRGTCSDILDIGIFHQTKTIGREERISMADRLRGSNYWDVRTGKVSRVASLFAQDLEKRRKDPLSLPWDWNPQNPNYQGDANINVEWCDNNVPNMLDVDGKVNLHDMYSWRREFVGYTFVPRDGTYRIPRRMGDFHERSMPSAWILKAARQLVAKAAEKLDVSDLDVMFDKVKKFSSALKHAQWSDAYLFGLLDKNVPNMISATPTVGAGTVYRIVPELTPEVRQAEKKDNKNPRESRKYPNIAQIEEVKPNRFGGWDLPDRDASILQDYPAGFNNGPGFLTLADEFLKGERSLWYQAAKEANDVVTFFRFLLKFLREYIGKTDVINGRLVPPWIHKESALIQLIERTIRPSGPVFVGIPGEINYEANGPLSIPTQKVDLVPDNILQNSVAATRAFLENAVATNAPRKPINNEERALSCLSEDAYARARRFAARLEAFGGDEATLALLTGQLHSLYDYLIKLCGHTKGESAVKTTDVQAASMIVDAFAAKLDEIEGLRPPVNATAEEVNVYRKDVVLAGLRGFTGQFNKVKVMQNFFSDLKKKLGPICVDYGVGFAEALKAYEKTPVGGFGISVGQGGGARTIVAPPVYHANYDIPPVKYLRAPLNSSQQLRNYLKNKAVAWILPADANLFYQYPEEPRIVTSNPTVEVRLHANKFALTSLSRSLQFQSRLNANKRPQLQKQAMDLDENNLFSSLKPMGFKRAKQLSMSRILDMGKDFRGDDDDDEDDAMEEDIGYRKQFMKEAPRSLHLSSQTGELELDYMLSDHYFGPWMSRLNFLNKEIDQLSEKFFFLAIIEAKNRLEVPIKMAAAGAQIFEVMIVRPFIEVNTNAMIAMKAGSDTMLTAVGHSHVQVTKESRGCWRIYCSFYLAIIKIKPENIALIPHAIPVSLVGGKTVEFMTDFSHWSLPNPNKESMIGFLIPVNERTIASPTHLRNNETFIRPGIDNAIWQRKCSAFGAWYDFLLRAQNPATIDVAHSNRFTYATCVNVSHVAHQGPATYTDPVSGKRVGVEGSGPMGSFRMNVAGVQNIYEGVAARFPDSLTQILNSIL
jgi:hypothetical protein